MVESVILSKAEYLSSELYPDLKPFRPLKAQFSTCRMFDGSTQERIRRIGSGSIIQLFEHTPYPEQPQDVVCPHFLELKWGYGCPYDCAWCFLKGTLRMLPEKTAPKMKSRQKVLRHVLSALVQSTEPEMFNTGEICDSLMDERSKNPFSKWIVDIFQTQKKHKVLFLTKSSYVKEMLKIDNHSQAIASFSLNASQVSRKWEKAPTPAARIKAAGKLFDKGWEVRVRIDPIVPVPRWKKSYSKLVEDIFSRFNPSRITLGTPRGLQSTLNNVTDKSWVKYLDSRQSGWGKKIADDTRLKIYRFMLDKLEGYTPLGNVALCKETLEMFDALNRDFRKQVCNCML